MYQVSGIKDFDLTHIFECGQCFRWERLPDGSYRGIANGRVVRVSFSQDEGKAECASRGQEGQVRPGAGTLTIDPCTEEEFEEIWRPYFDLDRDYSLIKKTLIATDEDEPIMARATEYGYGIRILKQDLWETIVSFIISQNNNIPRIKGCIERLTENFGEKIPVPEAARSAGASGQQGEEGDLIWPEAAYDIPSPERMAELTVDDLAPVRLGYRAKYLIDTAKSVVESGLPKAFDDLSELTGVGPKVASCISLFGMQGYSSFPIDVWVMRVMHELYGLDEKDKAAMARFAEERFGELGGFAQQYLFYYMRDRKGE